MKTNIQIKMFLLILTITVAFVAGLVIFKISDSNKLAVLLSSEKEEQTELTRRAVEMLSKSSETLAYDYSVWDEMVTFLKTRDPKWAAVNIDASLNTFKTESMWVYDAGLNIIYSKNIKNNKELKELPAPKERLREILKSKYFVHFFTRLNNDIYEIFCAPIQPSADTARQTAPHGFVLTGRLIGDDYLRQLSIITSAKAFVSADPFKSDLDSSRSKYVIGSSKILYGLDETAVGKIIVQKEQIKYETISKASEQQLYLLVIFALVILTALTGFVYYIISNPLKMISGALLESNTAQLENLQKNQDEFGQIASLIVNFFNQKNLLTKEINERILLEDELKKTKQELEVLVQKRTEQLTRVNKELAEDIALRKKIEAEMIIEKESSKLKSTLLLTLNHEFRTPLTGILGSAAILKDQLSNSPSGIFVEGIVASGNRLLRTFNSFLALSELELAEKEMKGEIVHLNQIVLQIVEKMKPEADIKGISIKVYSYHELHIPADEYFIKLTIINILDNAIKFTNQGEISIRLMNEIVNGTIMAKLEIADTGIGISKDHINFVFHEFRQVSEGIGRKFEGNGLGLTIAKKIVDRMGGNIFVKSELNKGSIFTILLPLIDNGFNKEGDISSEVFSQTEAAEEEEKPAESLRDILLVEDNFINAEVIATFLTGKFNIHHAYNGESAIKMAKNKQYNLILMDINLGEGYNGVETSYEIRKLNNYKDIPIVAVTGYSFLEEKEKLLDAGMSDYLAKPFDKKELIETIKRLLK